MEAERRKLPIGIQTFREIRKEGCYYADKTGHIAQLVKEGTHYFLSRPRRFGKSLLLDTIKELFEGSEERHRFFKQRVVRLVQAVVGARREYTGECFR